MASFKGVLRSLIVIGLVLGTGFLGLWFLSGENIEIKNQNSAMPSESQSAGIDKFSDIGGKTPQETIGLLAGSLEKNDLVLAVKYFVSENREMESEDLTKLYDADLLGELVKDLKTLKTGKMVDGIHYLFEVFDENGGTAAEIKLIKNEKGLWKIISL